MSRKRLFAILIPAVLLLPVLFFLAIPFQEEVLKGDRSLKIYARDRSLLNWFRDQSGAYTDWVSLENIPGHLVKAVIEAEDKRFFYHPGVDPLALGRAVISNISHGRVVSGGSTITQQLARTLFHGSMSRNNYLRKFQEVALALKLELYFSKDELLESYSNNMPLTGNTFGFASASQRIFGHNISFITREEAVALTVLLRQNYPAKNIVIKRFTNLWKKLYSTNTPDVTNITNNVLGTSLSLNSTSGGSEHFQVWLKNKFPRIQGSIITEIDSNLNRELTEIINSELAFLEKYDVTNSALVVLALPRPGEQYFRLVAMVGSKNFNGRIEGQVNGAITIRTAGSTLKPLIYGLAMDTMGYHPWTILHDRDIILPAGDGTSYVPENYDQVWWGPLTLREALVASRNIPAVATAHKLGIEHLYQHLLKAGFDHLQKGPEFYGPGLALGTGGASLMQLTRLYGALASGGVLYPVLVGNDDKGSKLVLGTGKRILQEATSYRLTHILIQREERWNRNSTRSFLDFPFEVAAKTGTSKDFRDAWVIGYTSRYVVGVWTGNFSGSTMKQVSGAWGAGRIFQQVMRKLAGDGKPAFTYPDYFSQVRLCRKSGMLAREDCPAYMELHAASDPPLKPCNQNHDHSAGESYSIISPVENETLIIDPTQPLSQQRIPLKFSCPRGPCHYSMNNGPRILVPESGESHAIPWRGRHVIRLYNQNKMVQTTRFVIE